MSLFNTSSATVLSEESGPQMRAEIEAQGIISQVVTRVPNNGSLFLMRPEGLRL